MSLQILAVANGISLATAKRYRRAGVDLSNHPLVEAYKQSQRSRRCVSKNFHKPPVTVTRNTTEELFDPKPMEDAIWRVHMMLVDVRDRTRDTQPDLHERLNAISAVTSPFVSEM